MNAGHNPGYLIVNGQIDTIKSHGLPIGILAELALPRRRRAPFPAGSCAVLYSDGITEAEDIDGEEFGNERLEALLDQHIDCSASLIRDQIADAVELRRRGAAEGRRDHRHHPPDVMWTCPGSRGNRGAMLGRPSPRCSAAESSATRNISGRCRICRLSHRSASTAAAALLITPGNTAALFSKNAASPSAPSFD